MPVLRRNAGGINPAELLKAALFEKQNNAEPGVVPDSMATNAYLSSIPASSEQEREGAVLQGEDQRQQDRQNFAQDQQQQESAANTGARVMGFENPRAQAEHSAQEKLQQILQPEEMKLKAAEAGADEARVYAQHEHELDRQSRADLVAAAQGGQTQRNDASIGARTQQFNTLHPPSPWDKLKGLLGMGAPAAAPAAPAGAPAGGMVQMVHPDGRPLTVPADQVEMAKSHGARLVQ